MAINYPRIIFLNLIVSVVLLVLIFKTGKISSFENNLFLIALAGFILSFFSKENLLVRYVKLTFLNSLFFGFLFALFLFITDNQAELTLKGLVFGSLLLGVPYFFGYIIGIIPQGIRERLRKQPIGQKLAE